MEKPRAKVLVVDDEVDILEILKLEFEDRGCEVMTAVNASEAMGLIEKTRFDVVISDVCMPGMSGADLLRTIESTGRSDRPFIIMMSGYSFYTPEQIQEMGSAGYLAKPFSHRQLVELIENYIVMLAAA